MTDLFSAGDTDVLRQATAPTSVFWYRVGRARTIVLINLGLTVLWLAVVAMLVVALGGGGTGKGSAKFLAFVLSGMTPVWAGFLGWSLVKLVPGRNDRVVISLRGWVRSQVDPLEEKIRALSDDELRAKRHEFVRRLTEGAALDDIRAEAYACVREASRRARNHRQFECQLIGGRVLEDCKIAEMRTGEGKTIVCYMAAYMKVLQGLKAHIVTVNDYLVQRDAAFARPIFELLGCTVGFITAQMGTWGAEVEPRRQAYGCDVTYGTNSEFGFDYLRDNMKTRVVDQVQGRQDFVVVDEVDSILIDEARTPLIISGPAHDDVNNYRVADNIARALIRKHEQSVREMQGRIDQVEANATDEQRKDVKFRDGISKFRSDPLFLSSDEADAIGFKQYFVAELDRKVAHMTENGAKEAQRELGVGSFYDGRHMQWPHLIDNALRAHLCFRIDRDYVIQDGVIVIVDEFTGRLMTGRQWSDGLHQAVEAKEKVQIKEETQTMATITLQNLFRMYKQLAGMTGTAMTEADEFQKIYRLEVIAIPTNKPVRRTDYNDKIYKSVENKYDAIVDEIVSYSQKGYPADPWSLYDMLRTARRRLRELRSAGEAAEADQQIAIIDDALRAFKDGEGDATAPEKAFLKLVGDRVGGRPILVGTTSVENSEKLSKLLTTRHGADHEVLNAKNHAREAEIVAKAGQQHETKRGSQRETHGNITIATNMAGRGTDIVLGPGVAAIGGLHVVGTERHESRRIDNQLRGRCGRQGDPGSSRFFLSLEDDLFKLFMTEWMLKMIARYGMVEGMPIESRQLTRNIASAQKKVEERNFGIRKNLLEYDEVMDHQRKTFYDLRQRAVVGRDLSELIWKWIDETVADAAERYYEPTYPAVCAAEWVSAHLGVTIDAEKLDTSELALLQQQVREEAGNETRSSVQRVFGEYIDPDSDPEDWDLRGLCQWVSQYGMNLTQRQARETDPADLMEQIVVAALKRIEEADLSGLEPFTNRMFGRARLVQWAHDKFGLVIAVDELRNASREDAERILREKMQAAYRQREIEYPVAAMINSALERGGQNVNEVYQRIANWVNRKYRLGWTYEHFVGKDPRMIFQELRALNEEYIHNGKMDPEIDAALREHPGEALVEWARERFGAVLEYQPVTPGPEAAAQLKRCAYEMFRFELTYLERVVVLSTLDSVWKDHMYAMDLLRHGIWLRGQAERDPKIEYKREGTRMFNEMMSNIRERVTDMIFKVQVSSGGEGIGDGPAAPAPARGPAPVGVSERKADATNVGFSSAAAERQRTSQPAGTEPQAPLQPIRRDTPKVGRNDPCPCGSGKKYKQCHGKGR